MRQPFISSHLFTLPLRLLNTSPDFRAFSHSSPKGDDTDMTEIGIGALGLTIPLGSSDTRRRGLQTAD